MVWSDAAASSEHLIRALYRLWTNTRCAFCLCFVSTTGSWLLTLTNRSNLVPSTSWGHRRVNVLLLRCRSWPLLRWVSVDRGRVALLLTWNDLSSLILRNTAALTGSNLLILSSPHVWFVLKISYMTMWCLLGWWLLLVFIDQVVIAWRISTTTKLLLVLLLLLLTWVWQGVTLLRCCLLLGLGPSWTWSLTLLRDSWTLSHAHVCWKDASVHLLRLVYLIFRSYSACWLSSSRLRYVLFA
jgi:hypothetical protein